MSVTGMISMTVCLVVVLGGFLASILKLQSHSKNQDTED